MKKVIETFNKDYETWLYYAKLKEFGLLDIPIITSDHVGKNEFYLLQRDPIFIPKHNVVIKIHE